jgi:hypothetical protein
LLESKESTISREPQVVKHIEVRQETQGPKNPQEVTKELLKILIYPGVLVIKLITFFAILVDIALDGGDHRDQSYNLFQSKSRKVLMQEEKNTLAVIADTICPEGSQHIPISGVEAGAIPYMENNLSRIPKRYRQLIRLLLLYIEYSPWIFGQFNFFSRLAQKKRENFLDNFKKRIYFSRSSMNMNKLLSTLAYFADPRVTKIIGCEPKPEPPKPFNQPLSPIKQDAEK